MRTLLFSFAKTNDKRKSVVITMEQKLDALELLETGELVTCIYG